MFIKNKKELAVDVYREQAIEMIEAGISAVNPAAIIAKAIHYNSDTNSISVYNDVYDLISGRIFVIGGGKAAGNMALKLEKIIGTENISAGVVACGSDEYDTEKIKIIKASHPIPDKKSIKSAEKILELKEKYKINEKDLIIAVFSGGASAMLELPEDGISLKDLQELYYLLLDSGANTKEINAVRKHISKIKGGKLGRFFAPAKIISLIISDVPQDDVSIIGSGPTAFGNYIFRDVRDILKKYNLYDKISTSIFSHIEAGCNNKKTETAKEVKNVSNYIVANNKTALENISKKAAEFGLRSIVASSSIAGESAKTAKSIMELIEENYSSYDVVVLGGEILPSLPFSHGKGGRNQHFVLASLKLLKEKKDWLLTSIASDGVDYIEGIGGAIADNKTLEKSLKEDLNVENYLQNYDSYSFFKKIGASLIKMDNTGTNIGDIIIYINVGN